MADNNELVPTQPKKKGFFYVLTHWREILSDAEQARAETQKAKAEAEKAKAEAERAKAEAEKAKSEAERVKAEAERVKAEAEKVKAEAEKTKAEAERVKAEAERTKQELENVANTLLSKEDKEGISKDERISRGVVIKTFKDLVSQELSDCEDKVRDIKRAQKIKEDTVKETEGLTEQEKEERLKQIKSDSKKDRIMALKMMQVKTLAHTAVYIDRGEKTAETREIHNKIVNKLDSICKGLDYDIELKRQYISTILEDTGFSKGFEQVGVRSNLYNDFPYEKKPKPVDLFGYYAEDGILSEYGIFSRYGGYKGRKSFFDFVNLTPSELIDAAEFGMFLARDKISTIYYHDDESIKKVIQQNLTDVGYASSRHLGSIGFKEVKNADNQIQSLDPDNER